MTAPTLTRRYHPPGAALDVDVPANHRAASSKIHRGPNRAWQRKERTHVSHCSLDGQPTGDGAALCVSHTKELVHLLAGAIHLTRELEVTLCRQDAVTPKNVGVSGSGEKPLPYKVHASDLQWALANTLRAWARDFHAVGIGPNPDTWGATGRNAYAHWLIAQMSKIRQRNVVRGLVEELRDITQAIYGEIDLPTPSLFAGPCDVCGRFLYTEPGTAVVECSCGSMHQVAERRAYMLASMERLVVTMAEARKLGLYLGVDFKQSTMSSWVSNGRVQAIGTKVVAGKSRETYYFGDLLDVKRSEVIRQVCVTACSA